MRRWLTGYPDIEFFCFTYVGRRWELLAGLTGLVVFVIFAYIGIQRILNA